VQPRRQVAPAATVTTAKNPRTVRHSLSSFSGTASPPRRPGELASQHRVSVQQGQTRGNVAEHVNVTSQEEFARCKEALGRVT